MNPHPALERTDHRPWPLPSEPWSWRQSWLELLFAHWPVAASVLQIHVPDRLKVQEWDGSAWLGLVPFRMEGVMRRPLPDVPGLSAFPELNVRTYVELRDGGSAGPRPGVWFFSLDATNALAVWAARQLFHLPYFRARIRHQMDGERVGFSCTRRGGTPTLNVSYGPVSDVYEARPGTLDHWLTERYCLYADGGDGTLLRSDVHHHPWPLQDGFADIERNTMLSPWTDSVPSGEPVLHYSAGVHTVVWSPVPV